MLLSDLPIEKFNLQLIRDSEFFSVGTQKTRNNKVLAPCYDTKYINQLSLNERISCVLLDTKLATEENLEKFKNHGILIANDASEVFFRIHNYLSEINGFYWKDFETNIDSSSNIHKTAIISEKNVKIGKNCNIGANVVILDRVTIGDNCNIKPNTVIGGNGFRVVKIDGIKRVINHTGSIRIENNVEIGSNCCIDKGDYAEETVLSENTKLDNLVQIGHNVFCGKNTIITACVIISGSVNIGENVYFGPNSTITNAVNIGDNCYITLGSILKDNLEANMAYAEGKIFRLDIFKRITSMYEK